MLLILPAENSEEAWSSILAYCKKISGEKKFDYRKIQRGNSLRSYITGGGDNTVNKINELIDSKKLELK
jgi:hypothetical protein